MINKNIFFINENKNYNDFENDALKLSAFLKTNNFKEISINLSNIFEFFVCFFGAMDAGIKSYLNNNQGFVINDENFKNCFLNSNGLALKFDENYEFFIKTSGSSGEPKVVKKSINQMLLEAISLQKFLEIKNYTFFSSVSHLNMFGLTFKVFLPLVCGGKIYQKDLIYPEIMKEIYFKNGVFITSPTVLNALKKREILPNLKDLRLVITAGSKLKESIRSALKNRYKFKIMEIYGSTETGVVARNFGDGFEIFDNVYLDTKQDQRLLINSPWCKDFLSSDMAKIDGKKLELLGRFDRVVKLNDMRFSLEEAENFLSSHSFIKEAKCSLLDDNSRISALIELSNDGKKAFLNNGKNGISNALKTYTREKFKTNIRYFKIISNFNLNQNGKFSKNDFENEYKKVKKPFLKEVSSGNEILFEVYFSEDLFFYEGHFNTFPITPGFVELGLIYEALSLKGFEILNIKSIENIKFTNPLRPFTKVFLTLTQKESLINFKIFYENKTYASGRVRFD